MATNFGISRHFVQLRNGAPRLRLKVPADGRKVQRNGSLLATGILQPRACLEQEPQGLQVATQGSMVQGRPIQGIPDLWVAEIYRWAGSVGTYTMWGPS